MLFGEVDLVQARIVAFFIASLSATFLTLPVQAAFYLITVLFAVGNSDDFWVVTILYLGVSFVAALKRGVSR